MSNVLKQTDGGVWYAEVVDWDSDDPHAVHKIGVSKHTIRDKASRGQSWALGQLYGVLGTGLISASHIFEGLRRSMCVGGDMEADHRKLAITWAARHDAQLINNNGVYELQRVAAPQNTVFVVHVSPNSRKHEYPEIFGWAEHWSWVNADSSLLGAPVDWSTRYDRRLWSRGGTDGR